MKAYSKPMAEVENFNLDSEFASGACGTIPQSQKDKYQSTFQGNLDAAIEDFELYIAGLSDGSEWLQQIADFDANDDLTFDKLTAMDPYGKDFENAVDRYTMYMINFSQDDQNSGFCYFTYNSGEGKTFS